MFANLLPSVREIRVPLTVGTFYLTAIFVLVCGIARLAHVDIDPLKYVEPFVKTFSAVIFASLVAFLAYIIGMLIPSPGPMHRRKLYRLSKTMVLVLRYLTFSNYGSIRKEIKELWENKKPAPARISNETLTSAVEYFESHTPEMRKATYENDLTRIVGASLAKSMASMREQLLKAVLNTQKSYNPVIDQQLERIKLHSARLQAKNEGLFNSYERAEAEASFRFGLVYPFAVLCAFSVPFLWSYIGAPSLALAIVALVICPTLAYRGRTKEIEANDAIVLSIIIGDIEPHGKKPEQPAEEPQKEEEPKADEKKEEEAKEEATDDAGFKADNEPASPSEEQH